MAERLNLKQRAFVGEYLKDLNATQAAIRAGYSAKTAKQQGARLLTNADVQAALAEAMEARSERTRVDADWLLLRLADQAEADIADLFDEFGNAKPVKEWPIAFRKGLVTGIEVEELFEGRGKAREKIGRLHKFKLVDRTKVWELLGRHVDVQAFKDKVEHEVSDAAALILAARARRLGAEGGAE